MSKSKGNVIDPLGVIDDFGADALRFALAAVRPTATTSSCRRSSSKTNRNFATKLWNACRFAEMNGCDGRRLRPAKAKETLNRWIAHETSRATREVTEALRSLSLQRAASAMYRFVWNVYCDWYLELAKPVLMGEEGAAKAETRAMVAWARDEILKLLHPFMPFITEELWAVTAKRDGLLVLAHGRARALPIGTTGRYRDRSPSDALIPPVIRALDAGDFSDPAAEAEIGWVVDLLTAMRSVKAEMNIPPATLTPLVLVGAYPPRPRTACSAGATSPSGWRDCRRFPSPMHARGAVQLLVRGEVVALPLKGVIDFAAERGRLDKEIGKADADIKRVDAKLSNEKFVANAKEEIVEEEKEKREAAVARQAKILEALERLKNAS